MVVYGCYSWSKGIKRRRNEHWVISTLSCKPIDYVPCLLTFHTFLFFCSFLEAILLHCCCLVLFVMFVLTILTEMKWEAEQIHHKTCVLRKHPRFGQLCLYVSDNQQGISSQVLWRCGRLSPSSSQPAETCTDSTDCWMDGTPPPDASLALPGYSKCRYSRDTDLILYNMALFSLFFLSGCIAE